MKEKGSPNGNPISHESTSPELHNLKERFLALFNNTTDAIAFFDVEQNVYQVNERFTEMFEYSLDEINGRNINDIVDTHRIQGDYLSSLFLEGQNIQLETTRYAKSGKRIDVLIKGGPVYENDLLTGGYVIYSDISTRKKIEAELRKQDELFKNLSKNVPGVIYQYQLFPDGRSCFPFASEGIWDIYRVTPEQVKYDATAVFERLHPKDYNHVVETIQLSAQTGEEWRCQFRVILPDAEDKSEKECWRFGQATPQYQKDGSILWHGYISNIDQQKDTEHKLIQAKNKAVEANKAKSLFLSNMSHELRTPMNAVIGMADLLEELITDKEHKKYIEILKKSGNNLLTIINNVLDLSKMETGNMELHISKTVLCKLLKEIESSYKILAEKKGIAFSVMTSNCTPQDCTVLIDEDKLRQILVNLIGNAIKFTKNGQITLKLKIIDDSTIELSVTDTGIGIPKTKIIDIFKPFKQADTSITKTFGGSGLGLTISKKLVDLMGGKIWADSVEGLGSTFTFQLPYVKAEIINYDLSKPNVPTQQKENSVSLQPLAGTILLVEDIAENRLLIEAYLKKEPIKLHYATNGKEAVSMYKESLKKSLQERYALILMDVQMPIMDGYQATKEIRKIEKENSIAPVPIWALTAYALNEEKEKSMAAGCNKHIIKPIKKAELMMLMSKLNNCDSSCE